MTAAKLYDQMPKDGKSGVPRHNGAAIPRPFQPQISGAFQLLLGLYIIATGYLPTVIQSMVFGLQGEAESDFAAAMLTAIARDILLLAPVLILARNPAGILHPLLLAVVVWPLLVRMPTVIQDYGGWAGVLAGLSVETPAYAGLRLYTPTAVWSAIAKYNALEIMALLSTYCGFWAFGRRPSIPIPVTQRNSADLGRVLLFLIAFSTVALLLFLLYRGGLSAHLFSLGGGRFRELQGLGPIMALVDLGAVALYVWIAARPRDARSLLFLVTLGIVIISQFVSNGSRGSALEVPLVVGLIWALRTHKVPWKLGLLILPIMFAAIGLLGELRTSSWTGSTAGDVIANATWGQSFARAHEEISSREWLSAHVPIVERGFARTEGPLAGQTYVAAVAAFVPRFLWEDKPRGAGPFYAQVFLGAPREGLGIPVNPTAEAYWNFGFPGVLLVSFFYGWLLNVVYHFYSRRKASPFATVFYVLFVTAFHFSTKRMVDFQQQAAMLFIAYVAVSLLLPARRYVSDRFAVRPQQLQQSGSS